MPPSQKLHRSLLGFIEELSRNNKREWFQANKERYVAEVRDPLLGFIEAFAPKLRGISPHYVADARPNGGSLFRIYRDTRFSKDKTPYKTWGAVQFRHERGKDVHAPGFYLHVQPGNVFMGAGLWHPDAPTLANIREAIVEGPANWNRAIGTVEVSGFGVRLYLSQVRQEVTVAPAGIAFHLPVVIVLGDAAQEYLGVDRA